MTCPAPDADACTDQTPCDACPYLRQALEHAEQVARADAAGKCWASGLHKHSCHLGPCDCFEPLSCSWCADTAADRAGVGQWQHRSDMTEPPALATPRVPRSTNRPDRRTPYA